MGRCPVRLHQLPAIGPGTSDTAARPGRSVAAGNILDVGQASSLGAWRVLHGHLPGKPDARPSARSASGCTIPHHDSTPDQPGRPDTVCQPDRGQVHRSDSRVSREVTARRTLRTLPSPHPERSAARCARPSPRADHLDLCGNTLQSMAASGNTERRYLRVPDRCRGYGVQPDVDAAIWPQALGTARRRPVRPRADASCTEAAPPRRRWLACRARSTSPRPDGRWHNATTPFELQFA